MTTQKILTREFVLNFLAQFAFSFVSFILVPTIPIYLSRFQAKAGEIGLLVGILSVSDCSNKKRIDKEPTLLLS